MCGISGIFHFHGQASPADAAVVERMTRVLEHRGPNDHGAWTCGPISLGHRRLSVIDLSRNGRQPMANEDGSIRIVFNGEIYNFAELKARHRLVDKGHVFQSATDTEVLIHLYEELGPAMAEELNGMFAFALWDGGKQQLHLARDRHGIKPLFYSRVQDCLLFGSEIKAILQHPKAARRINTQALHDFLTFAYIPGSQTAFAGIEELDPAHWMTIDRDGRMELRRYWNLRFDVDHAMSEQEAVEGARARIDQAVKRQLVADVPIGVLLSGGMDSSTLVAVMKRHTKEPVHTYSVGFEDSSFNELPYARMVANCFSTVAREIVVTPSLVNDLLPGYLRYIDEPYADGSAIPTYYVCQIAKDEVVVVLSGEGGDEVFAGYDTHAAYKASRLFSKVPRWIRRSLIAPIVNLLPVSNKKLSLEFKMKRFLGGQDLPPAAAHLWWRIVLSEQQKLALYTPRVLDQLDLQASDRHFHKFFAEANAHDTLNRLLYIDSSVFLPDDLMIKNDRMSMAHSLEARVPFTDHDLVEFMARVPMRWKLPGLRKKHILRSAMDGVLPPQILNKKKVGLEMPYSSWLKKELNGLLRKYLSHDRIMDTGLFRPEGIQRLVDEHISNKMDHGRALWGLLNYMMWMEIYDPTLA
jgi:asparagine synthase (glutamine-hydrolysing)